MLKLAELIRENNRYRDFSNNRQILYLSNLVLIPFDEILFYHLRLLGLSSGVKIGMFNSIVTEIVRYSDDHDAIVVNYDPFAFMLESNYYLRKVTSKECQNLEDNFIQLINQMIQNLPPDKPVIFLGLVKPKIRGDKKLSDSIQKTVKRCNTFLESLENDKRKVLDLQKLIRILGKEIVYKQDFNSFDPSPYTFEFVKYLSEIMASMLANQLLNYKKLLVLDCDNTLWGGVAAEVGYKSLVIGGSSKQGRIFLELQLLFKNLNQRGVILALCSKNSEMDVVEVFENNNDMALELDQFASKKINWVPKSKNILEICLELNLSPDSVVFIDDSLFEIHEVMSLREKISCMSVPVSSFEVDLLRWKLDELFPFKITTSEDMKKTRYYHDAVIRKQQLGKFLSYEEYLRSLETRIELNRLSSSSPVDRVSQLSLKTNQFNFMHARLDPDSIIRMLNDKKYSIYTGAVFDNVGDTGIVFLLISEAISAHPREIRVVEMVLSCRVFGRNIAERAFVYIIEHFRKSGIERVFGIFEKTNKNSQFSEFFPSLGFKLNNVNSANYEYVLDLSGYTSPEYDYPTIKANF